MWWMEELFGYEVMNVTHFNSVQMGLQMGQYF